MLLITEDIPLSEMENDIITEGKEKTYYIKGPFFQSTKKNRNERVYSKDLMLREIAKYKKAVENALLESYGELNHPKSPNINHERVTHRTVEIIPEGIYSIGKAKIMDTTHGNIIKKFIDEGTKIGISSRGVGTVNESGVVNDDYNLITFDIVSDPSGQECFTQGLMEGAEWVFESGIWTKKALEDLKDDIDKVSNKPFSKEERQAILESFSSLFRKL